MSSRHPLVIGHRGASGYRPEHTRAAYDLAFEQGVDAVEPDLVPTKDGVLVIRHENEISSTTDVAAHPEFSDRRTTRRIDGQRLTGWFTEDFTWAELSTLRAVERLPSLRPASAAFDRDSPILRLADLMAFVDTAADRAGRELVMVAELKHATYFDSIGLPLGELFAGEIGGWASPTNLVVESFEQPVLTAVRERGIPGRSVFLVEASGAPADLVARSGRAARSYADHLTAEGMAELAGHVDGVSVDKSMLLARDAAGRTIGDPALVDRAHAAGLDVFTWTLRAENRFLAPFFRRGTRPADHGDWLGEFRTVIGTGVDGVFADQPDLAFAALAPTAGEQAARAPCSTGPRPDGG